MVAAVAAAAAQVENFDLKTTGRCPELFKVYIRRHLSRLVNNALAIKYISLVNNGQVFDSMDMLGIKRNYYLSITVKIQKLKMLQMKKKYLLIALSVFTMGIMLSGCYCERYHHHHYSYYR